jgi:protocatechuate 3,4-dioxygenase beta subunit
MSTARWSRNRAGLWVAEPSRRSILRGASAGAAALLLGCDGPGGAASPMVDAGPAPTMPDGSAVDCVLRPEQTEGPFPNRNDDPLRADIRSEPSDGSLKPGVPLRLVLRFGQVEADRCTPLPRAIVDVWQCDALGIYAGYEDAPGKKFLRGYQETDSSGTVEFLTIYPGSYQPRPIHIHFSVRMSRAAAIRTADPAIFVSQLYFPLELSQEIVKTPAYAGGAPPTSNTAADRPWVLTMEPDGPGWRGLLDIGVRLP